VSVLTSFWAIVSLHDVVHESIQALQSHSSAKRLLSRQNRG